jgi:hypothetical protein
MTKMFGFVISRNQVKIHTSVFSISFVEHFRGRYDMGPRNGLDDSQQLRCQKE